MAINILDENEYIVCPKCGSKIFYSKDIFALKKISIHNETKVQKIVTGREFTCSVCNTIINKKLEEIGGRNFEYNN